MPMDDLIKVIDRNTSTNNDGDQLYNFIVDNISHNKIIIHFSPNITLTSSYLNSSFGKFIDVFGIDKLKTKVKVKTNKSTFSVISKYLDNYNHVY
ncbi:MAG: STAS-like domain-containing protein [Bacteroidota bacterium]